MKSLERDNIVELDDKKKEMHDKMRKIMLNEIDIEEKKLDLKIKKVDEY